VRLGLLHFLGQRWKDSEEIADDAEIGDPEDRRFGSLLMAMMCFEEDMPARCWMAPETPAAI
jgi:hypothetical protein